MVEPSAAGLLSPAVVATIIRWTRVGAPAPASWFCNKSREGLFSTFQCASLSAASWPVTPREVTSNSPCDRFMGVLPRTSSGCVGTIPIVPMDDLTHVPVIGLHRPTPTLPPGLHSHPTPG